MRYKSIDDLRARAGEHYAQQAISQGAAGATLDEMTEASERKRKPSYTAGEMNETESSFAWRLQVLVSQGALQHYVFEPFTTILADDVTYKPDFIVTTARGDKDIVEVKGDYAYPDAILKFRWSSSITDTPHLWAQYLGPEKGWKIETWVRGRRLNFNPGWIEHEATTASRRKRLA